MLGDSAAGIRAVLFDFDDTLQDRSRAFDKFTAFFMDKYFPHLSGEEKARRGIEMRERNNGGYVNYIDYFASLVESWRWEGAPEVGDLYREFQFRFPECSTLFPETKEVLTELRRRGFLLGIVTNGPSIKPKPEAGCGGPRPFVDLCMVLGDEQVHKPDPEIFRRAASRLGVACGSCLYVGDHPVNDIEGAAAAGMRPVYINARGGISIPTTLSRSTRCGSCWTWCEPGPFRSICFCAAGQDGVAQSLRFPAGMASCSFDGAMDGTAPKNRHIINRIDKGRAV